MINGVYAIFDSKAGAYMLPFFAPTKGLAVRNVSSACMDEHHDFCLHSQDFSLYYLGDFDDSSGCFDVSEPIPVISCSEIKEHMKNG